MTGSTAFVVEIQALQKLLAEKDAEIERLKALLTRAADALKYMEVNWPNEKKGDYDPLIRQLRKAAE